MHLDGNVLAGPLLELFREDMTAATARCDGCGDVSVLATAMVYDAAPGWCVRCHVCNDVLMTFVQAGLQGPAPLGVCLGMRLSSSRS